MVIIKQNSLLTIDASADQKLFFSEKKWNDSTD